MPADEIEAARAERRWPRAEVYRCDHGFYLRSGADVESCPFCEPGEFRPVFVTIAVLPEETG